MKHVKVSDWLQAIRSKHGKETANKAHRLMIDWDGSDDVSQAFYEADLLNIKLKEALGQ